jgi:hypothetical protein
MYIHKVNKWGERLLWLLNPMLIVLAYFNEHTKFSNLIQWFGKLHPLVLHFPIVLGIAIVVYLVFFQAKKLAPSTEKLLFTSNALLASLVALFGLFLSKQDAYDNTILNVHKWGGVAITVISWSFIYMNSLSFNFKRALGLSYFIALVIFTHKGAQLTHGEEVLSFPKPIPVKISENINADSTLTVYEKAIAPILEQKCIGCHGPEKIKGNLQLSSPELIIKGGKNGSLLNSINNQEALLLQRIHLPNADEKHMPPDGKIQLTLEELTLLNRWVKAGGDFKKKINEMVKTDSLAIMAIAYKAPIRGEENSKGNAFDLKQYNTSYCTVNYSYYGSDEVFVDFFQGAFYKTASLKKLAPIKDKITSLNMQGMPLTKEDLGIVASFPNLRKLNLNYTKLSLSDLIPLKNLIKLKNISICGMELNPKSLASFIDKAPFTQIQIWNNHTNEKEYASLIANNKKIKIIVGDNLDDQMMKITSPVIEQDSSIIIAHLDVKLKHFMKGATIRYTLDGTDPDSLNSPIYTKKFQLLKNSVLKTKAFKPGWLSSDIVQKTFYKSEIHPDSIYFVTQPDKKYPGINGAKTLIDYELGEQNFSSGKWLAYRDSAMMFMINFKEAKQMHQAHFNAFIDNGAYIFPILSIKIEGSNDGKSFKYLNEAKFPSLEKIDMIRENKSFSCAFPEKAAYKYYRFTLLNLKKLPKWHPGKGTPAWIFVDELFLD